MVNSLHIFALGLSLFASGSLASHPESQQSTSATASVKPTRPEFHVSIPRQIARLEVDYDEATHEMNVHDVNWTNCRATYDLFQNKPWAKAKKSVVHGFSQDDEFLFKLQDLCHIEFDAYQKVSDKRKDIAQWIVELKEQVKKEL